MSAVGRPWRAAGGHGPYLWGGERTQSMRPWTQTAPLGPMSHLQNGNKTSTHLPCALWGRDATPCTDEGPGSEQ